MRLLRSLLAPLAVGAALFILTLVIARADPIKLPQTVDFDLPSQFHSGYPNVDTIRLRYYPCEDSDGVVRMNCPAAVLIPAIGSDEQDPLMRRIAHYLTTRGIHCAVISLPFHGKRSAPGEDIVAHYAGGNASLAASALQQSALDVSTVGAWLAARPEVDPNRIGIVGISLGAIVAHLAMGRDNRFGAGVAVLGAGDLQDIDRRSLLAGLEARILPHSNTEAEWAALRRVDPMTYASRNRPRHVLMIQAARDIVIPQRDATELWTALGKPPIQWVDTNHFALGIAPESAMAAMSAYLWSIWSAPGTPDPPVPTVYAPTIKLGFLMIHNSRTYMALQYQLLAIGRKSDHTSLLHVDVGTTTSRPFATLGYTVNPFIDAGYAMRVNDSRPQPYLSVHLVF